jgi:hypothetical protein
MNKDLEPIIFFRKNINFEEELEVAKKFFEVKESRVAVKDRLVIPRYSGLPYYKELEEDLKYNGSALINSYSQHRWIANFEYYDYLKYYTFESWSEEDFHLCDYDGPFVVKGKTNSRKSRWNTQMYAKDKKTALEIGWNLASDLIIGEQGIIYRKYIPLKTFEIGINGSRFVNEWRLFYLNETLVDHGYYWSTLDDLSLPYFNDKGFELANKVAKICSQYVNFFAIDIAEKEDGEWILVEVNDGSMSGLSMIEPENFYKNLKFILNQNKDFLL